MKMIKTKTTVLAYVYVSNDESSVSAWCLHWTQNSLLLIINYVVIIQYYDYLIIM